jgi:hypothetical protein
MTETLNLLNMVWFDGCIACWLAENGNEEHPVHCTPGSLSSPIAPRESRRRSITLLRTEGIEATIHHAPSHQQELFSAPRWYFYFNSECLVEKPKVVCFHCTFHVPWPRSERRRRCRAMGKQKTVGHAPSSTATRLQHPQKCSSETTTLEKLHLAKKQENTRSTSGGCCPYY